MLSQCLLFTIQLFIKDAIFQQFVTSMYSCLVMYQQQHAPTLLSDDYVLELNACFYIDNGCQLIDEQTYWTASCMGDKKCHTEKRQ